MWLQSQLAWYIRKCRYGRALPNLALFPVYLVPKYLARHLMFQVGEGLVWPVCIYNTSATAYKEVFMVSGSLAKRVSQDQCDSLFPFLSC